MDTFVSRVNSFDQISKPIEISLLMNNIELSFCSTDCTYSPVQRLRSKLHTVYLRSYLHNGIQYGILAYIIITL